MGFKKAGLVQEMEVKDGVLINGLPEFILSQGRKREIGRFSTLLPCQVKDFYSQNPFRGGLDREKPTGDRFGFSK